MNTQGPPYDAPTTEERELLAIVRGSPDLLTVVSASGTARWIGGRVEAMLGVSSEALVGPRAWDPVHRDDLQAVLAELQRIRERPRAVVRMSFRMQRVDGATFDVESILQNRLHDPDVRALVMHTRSIEDRLARDAVTGLPSRRVFVEALADALAESQETGTGVAVLVVDIDRFKSVNDSFGLPAGDALLVGVAKRLQQWLRPGDAAARVGGDEFALLFAGITDDDEVQTLADGVLQGLTAPFRLPKSTVWVTACVGHATSVEPEIPPTKLLGNAMTALHHAKASGPGRMQGFAGAMRSEAQREATLELDLHQAVRRGELLLHYQPIIRLDQPRLLGFEALVRWRSEARGFVPPSKFIPAAEAGGMIFKIEAWILRNAFRQSVLWHRDHFAGRSIVLSINLSAHQLARADFLPGIDELLQETGADPERLRFEVTESAFMTHPERAAAHLRALKERGFKLAIDDFGTGYASLAQLHAFPFDTLKIDQSFVARLGVQDDAHRLVHAILRMAAAFGMDVVAEGVETREQVNLLRSLGCVIGQGFLFSKPMSAARVTSYLRRMSESGPFDPRE